MKPPRTITLGQPALAAITQPATPGNSTASSLSKSTKPAATLEPSSVPMRLPISSKIGSG
jgi:hypothetical protein